MVFRFSQYLLNNSIVVIVVVSMRIIVPGAHLELSCSAVLIILAVVFRFYCPAESVGTVLSTDICEEHVLILFI